MPTFVDPTTGPRRLFWLVFVAVVAVVTVIGSFLIGRVTAPSGGGGKAAVSSPTATDSAVPPVAATSGGLPGAPTQVNSLGIPVGYPHTQAGAISACGNYVAAVQKLSSRNTQSLRGIFASVSTAGETEVLTNMILNADKQTAKNFQVTSINDPNFNFDLRVVGYKIQTSAADQTTVAVWSAAGVGVYGRDDELAAQQRWGTDICTVKWSSNDWKLSEVKDGPDGPAIDERPADDIERFSFIGGSSS